MVATFSERERKCLAAADNYTSICPELKDIKATHSTGDFIYGLN